MSTDPIPEYHRPLQVEYNDRNGSARTCVLINPNYDPISGRLRGNVWPSYPSPGRGNNVLAFDSHVLVVYGFRAFEEGAAALARVNSTVTSAGEAALPPAFDPSGTVAAPSAEARAAAAAAAAAAAVAAAAAADAAFAPRRRGHAVSDESSIAVEIVGLRGASRQMVQVIQLENSNVVTVLNRDAFTWEWDG